MERLTVWSNASLPAGAMAVLREGLGAHRLVMPDSTTSNLGAGGPDPSMEGCDVAFGQPDPGQAMGSGSLKWVQITSAGYTRYDDEAFFGAFRARGAAFTNSSSVYDEPCAEHLLAFMLAHARQLPTCFADQLGNRGWPHGEIRPACSLMTGQSVLLLGFGAIAVRLAELLVPFRMKVSALRRTVRGDESVPTLPISDLLAQLPYADHVVNVLPASPSTDGLLGPAEFAAMKPGAVFYNVGRGTTVDQVALMEALNSGRLAAAYLDVTDPEPLPSGHALWSTPNCVITPHTAGGHFDEHLRLVRHFLANLRRFEAGENLADRVV